MSGLKTLIVSLCSVVLCAAPASSLTDLARDFATCTGQLSAMVEHAWLIQDPRSDKYDEDREKFLALLEAVGAGTDPAALNQRIEAKVALMSVLNEARFGTDEARSMRAERRAEAQLAACRLMLLGG